MPSGHVGGVWGRVVVLDGGQELRVGGVKVVEVFAETRGVREPALQNAEVGRPEAAETLGSLAMSLPEPSTTIHDLQESALHCICASRSPWDPSCSRARASSTTS